MTDKTRECTCDPKKESHTKPKQGSQPTKKLFSSPCSMEEIENLEEE
ncbi:MAG: hypothetical protein QGH21_05990 [Candidatus Poseidoniia archaeon]|jgi:hypothetical protein|nr:hypothetical protein [Candidatus Poseidoniia archaeon]MDP7006813.1 hypothetical protein [Candidatus Poseidoniia archaeon]